MWNIQKQSKIKKSVLINVYVKMFLSTKYKKVYDFLTVQAIIKMKTDQNSSDQTLSNFRRKD